MVKAPDLKSKSHSDHLLDLFQVVSGSTPLWFNSSAASCQLGFLTR